MTWIAPDVDRVFEQYVADERTMLEGWLDWQRQTLLWKCAGLTAEQLAQRTAPPSELCLLGSARRSGRPSFIPAGANCRFAGSTST